MKIVEYDFIPAKKQQIKGSDKQVVSYLKSCGYLTKKKKRSGDVEVYKPCKLNVKIALTDDGPEVWHDLYNEIKRVYGDGNDKIFKKHFEKFLAEYDKGIRDIELSEDGKKVVIVFKNKRRKK